MNCFICKKDNTPWLVLKNENIYTDKNGKNIGDKIQVCSFRCSNKCDKFLPKNYSHLVLNKEDFCYLRPITKLPKKKFNRLTFDEIQNLSLKQREEYYFQKNQQLEFDPLILELHKEMEIEDQHTYEIENQNYSSESEYFDDY